MQTETLYAIGPDRTQRVEIRVSDVNILPSLASSLTEAVTLYSPNVLEFKDDNFGCVSIALTRQQEVWSTKVKGLWLEAPWRIEQNILTPAFETTLPRIRLCWKVPLDMNVVLASIIETIAFQRYTPMNHWLVAFDANKQAWRLPLTNLHNDCKLCHGQEYSEHSTKGGAFKQACEAFSHSVWNADLFNEQVAERTRLMFRFRPTTDSFEQLPIALPDGQTHWSSLCEKISNEFIQRMVIP